MAKQDANRPLQRIRFTEVAMSKCRKIVEVERGKSLVESLLLAQSFDAARVPSGVKFPFVNAESRSKAHERRANESTGEAETHDEQQAPKADAEQIHGCIGRGHSYPRTKRLPPCALQYDTN